MKKYIFSRRIKEEAGCCLMASPITRKVPIPHSMPSETLVAAVRRILSASGESLLMKKEREELYDASGSIGVIVPCQFIIVASESKSVRHHST